MRASTIGGLMLATVLIGPAAAAPPAQLRPGYAPRPAVPPPRHVLRHLHRPGPYQATPAYDSYYPPAYPGYYPQGYPGIYPQAYSPYGYSPYGYSPYAYSPYDAGVPYFGYPYASYYPGPVYMPLPGNAGMPIWP